MSHRQKEIANVNHPTNVAENTLSDTSNTDDSNDHEHLDQFDILMGVLDQSRGYLSEYEIQWDTPCPLRFPLDYHRGNIDDKQLAYVQVRVEALKEQCLSFTTIKDAQSMGMNPTLRRPKRRLSLRTEFFDFCGIMWWKSDTSSAEQSEIVNLIENNLESTGWTNAMSILREEFDNLQGFFCFFSSTDGVGQSLAEMSWRNAYKKLPGRLHNKLNLKPLKGLSHVFPLVIENNV